MPICASWCRPRTSTARSSEEPHVAFDRARRAERRADRADRGRGRRAGAAARRRPGRQGRGLSRPARRRCSRTGCTSSSSRRGDAVEEAAEDALIDLAYARDLPLVATNPAAYADPSFHAAHDAMLCIAHSAYVESDDRVTSSPEAWLKDGAAMARAVRRSARSDRQHRGRRPALRRRRAQAPPDPAAASATTRTKQLRRDARAGLAERHGRAASEATDARQRFNLSRAARFRARRHHPHGVRRLLPDRRRLHQMGQGERHPGRAGARLGRGLGGRLGADHHRPRPDRARTCCSSASSIPNACRCPTSTSISAKPTATR